MDLWEDQHHSLLIWVGMRWRFKYRGGGTPEVFFINTYVDEVYGSEQVCTHIKQLHKILDDKWEKADLN